MEKLLVLPVMLVFLGIVCTIADSDSYNIKAGYVLNGRQKRSWVSFQFAWRHILKEAHVVIYTRNLQLYSKPGNVDNAIDDFYALHPTYITTDPDQPNLLFGQIGTYMVSLLTGPTDPGKSKAVLTLMKKDNPGVSSRLIYYEDL